MDLNNKIINGKMDFWQRGTSFSTPSSSAYTADRFAQRYDGTIGAFTLSRQSFTVGQTVVPGNPAYFMRWNQTSAGSGSTFRTIHQRIEDVNTLQGRKAVITFWAKADASRSVGVAALQNFGTGGSPSSDVPISGSSVNLTTSWQKFRVDINIPSISGKTLGTDVPNSSYLEIQFNLPVNTTMTIDLTEVMVNDTHANPLFVRAGRAYGEELELCQRYFEKSYEVDVAPATVTNDGAAAYAFKDSAPGMNIYWTEVFKVTKRIRPATLNLYTLQSGTLGQITEIKQANTMNDVSGQSTFSLSEKNFTLTVNSSNTTAGFATHWTAESEL